jgi:hypothetical protein
LQQQQQQQQQQAAGAASTQHILASVLAVYWQTTPHHSSATYNRLVELPRCSTVYLHVNPPAAWCQCIATCCWSLLVLPGHTSTSPNHHGVRPAAYAAPCSISRCVNINMLAILLAKSINIIINIDIIDIINIDTNIIYQYQY